MKKIVSIAILLAVLLTLAACGTKDPSAQQTRPQSQQAYNSSDEDELPF